MIISVTYNPLENAVIGKESRLDPMCSGTSLIDVFKTTKCPIHIPVELPRLLGVIVTEIS